MADPYRTAALRAGRRPNLYVPEENQEWQEGQKLIGPEAAWRRNYEFVLQQTGDPQRAEAAANSIARTERRQELTQLATSVAGPVMRGGELATGLARTVMGGSRAAEAPAAMRALPPPRRNAMYPDEMLTPDVIPMGGPSFNTPRLTFAKPETRYRMAVDRPAQGRPLTNYERPAIDETFVRPEDVRPFSSGSVRGTVDPLDVLAAEGGPSSEAVELAQRIARQRAEGRAATVANEEARFAGGEGPNYAEEVLNQRRLAAEQRARAAEQEARFQSSQLDAMANEGGGAGRQATINELNRAAEADFRARQMGVLDDEAGAITSGRNPPQRVARALQVVERQAAAPAAAPAPGPGTGFIMVDSPGQGFTMVNPPSRAVSMRTVGSEAAPTSAPASSFYSDPAIAAIAARKIPGGASPSGSYLPLFAGATLAGTALLSGQNQPGSPGQAGTPASSGAGASGIPSGYTVDDQSVADLPRYIDTPVGELDPKYAATVAAAKRQSAPMPPTRPAELAREQPGILSRIFSGQDYQSKGGQLRQDGKINWGDPESAADFFRASKALQETPEATGMKRGGAAGKPDSVHKALEIIHHLISSR
jgi:hypothetical protein